MTSKAQDHNCGMELLRRSYGQKKSFNNQITNRIVRIRKYKS
jgi:hypothetical protein